MVKKNQKLFIIVGVLLLFGGTSLAYFASKVLFNGSGGVTSATTATIRGATIHTEGVLDIDSNILPGHKAVSIVKVTATGNNEFVPYNLVWNGTNTFSKLNYKVYKTTTRQNVTTTCNTEKTVIDGAQVIGEVCNITNLDKIGNSINEGTIIKNDTKKVLTKDEFITATSDGSIIYYYIVIEYENLDISQNDGLRASINGKIKAEESNAKADINIIAAYIKQDDGSYEETIDIPQSGYVLNKEKSTCSNGASIEWNYSDKKLITSNLTKSGTSCYLYFDKFTSASETLLATGNLVNEKGYRYEGSNPNNYVTFNNELWRIIGVFDTTVVDETIGTNKQEQLIKIIRDESIGNIAWDSSDVNTWSASSLKTLLNEGDYYTRSVDYSSNGLTNEAKKMIENVVWHLGGADNAATADTFYSAERGSTGANGTTDNSKLKWTGKVGLMYPSDYGYASPANSCARTTNLSIYRISGCYDNNWLYKSPYFQWTITPNPSSAGHAFHVFYDGYLTNASNCGKNYGTRPSIYLKSNVRIVDGKGTNLEPYMLSGN